VKQLTFEFMLEGVSEKVICLEEKVKKELITHMAAFIIEVLKNEGRKIDDNFSE
jgi:hypothetical protein